MLCSLKNHISTFTYFFSLLLFSLFFSVFFSDNSFAISLSDSFTRSNYNSTIILCDNQLIDSGNQCLSSGSPLSYFYAITSPVALSTSYTTLTSRLQVKAYVYNSSNQLTPQTFNCYFLADSCYFHFNSIVQKLELSVYRWSDLLSNDSVISFSFSDSSPFSSPSGSLSITSNGTYDVSNYAEAVVDVPPIPGDYHSDLVSLNNTLVLVPAVALVIFLLYLLNRIFIKGGDS